MSVLLVLQLAPDASFAEVAAAMRTHHPGLLQLGGRMETPEGAPLPLWQAVVRLESVGAAEDAAQAALAVPGVEDVEVLFPRQVRAYDAWFRDRLGAVLARDGA